MSSPFSTIEAFNSAAEGPTEGAIYTFASTPIINNIALLVAVGIFIWFIASTYTIHSHPSTMNKSLDRLSSFIVIGLLSLVAADLKPSARMDKRPEKTAQADMLGASRRAVPFGLLGLVSAGLSPLGRSKAQAKRRGRRINKKQLSRKARSRDY